MKFTETIEKVANNLQIQENLKNSLANAEQAQKDYEEKLVKTKSALVEANIKEEELKENLLSSLREETTALNNNLDFIIFSKFECGLTFKFLKKEYDLLAMDHLIEPNNKDLKPELYLEEMLEKYLNNGKVMFNEETIANMQEIKKLYDIDPKSAAEKLVSLVFNRKVRKMEKQTDEIKLSIKNILENLDNIHIDLKKSKDFKSPLLRKVFTKRDKLEKEEKDSYAELDKLNKELKLIEEKLANKEAIKNGADLYVKSELDALKNCFAWIESFESIKLKLSRYKVECIRVIERQIKDLEEKLAITKTQIKENKGMLQLNRKINNETIVNAFANQEFVDKLNANKSVSKENEKAMKLVKAKYTEYLQGCIEKLVV